MASSSFAAITEVVISAETIKDFGETSPENTGFARDADASNGLAFQFIGGAVNPPVEEPPSWWEVEFWCEAGTYFVYARGKSDGDTGSDAFWLQFDNQIGTLEHTADPDFLGRGLGNWRDVFDAGIYKWISQGVPPRNNGRVGSKRTRLPSGTFKPEAGSAFFRSAATQSRPRREAGTTTPGQRNFLEKIHVPLRVKGNSQPLGVY